MEISQKCFCNKKGAISKIFLFRFVFQSLAVSLLFLLLFCFVSFMRYGNIRCGLAYVSGYAIYAENTEYDVGDLEKGSEVSGRFQICNLINKPVKVIGAIPDCSCVIIEDLLPFTLEPLGKQELPFRFVVSLNNTEGEKVYFVRIVTDVDSPILVLKIRVNIV